jgi:16S rRNA (guanine966-N2)-methyltransferase
MRIIAGEWGGRPLQAKPNKNLRPTSDKVREAIFSQLESKWVKDWAQTSVLDLFAGTGALAFEALSRNAKRAVIVDHHLQTVRAIQKTIEEFDAAKRAEVLCKGALEAIRWLHQRHLRVSVRPHD